MVIRIAVTTTMMSVSHPEVVALPLAVVKPLTIPLNRLEMIPAKISRLMPLPIPFSVIRSPIHIARAVPPAMLTPTRT